MPARNPIRPADAAARALAGRLLAEARFGALAVTGADGAPQISRVALARAPEGQPLTLVSGLSAHSGRLRAAPACALLVGEPGPRGDPLTHPRMSLTCTASFVEHGGPGWSALRAHYLAQRPKARLYIDLADFVFARLLVRDVALNGGFGRAHRLTPADLGLAEMP